MRRPSRVPRKKRETSKIYLLTGILVDPVIWVNCFESKQTTRLCSPTNLGVSFTVKEKVCPGSRSEQSRDSDRHSPGPSNVNLQDVNRNFIEFTKLNVTSSGLPTLAGSVTYIMDGHLFCISFRIHDGHTYRYVNGGHQHLEIVFFDPGLASLLDGRRCVQLHHAVLDQLAQIILAGYGQPQFLS